MMVQQVKRRILSGRIGSLLSQNRVVTIFDGVGAGLKFDTHRGSGKYWLGTNELPVQQTLARQLRPGDVFYDVGANTGFFTVIGARLVGSKGRVYAFEPVPENVAVVRRNLQFNGFEYAEVIPKAVSFSSEQGSLILTRHPGGATLITDNPPPDAIGTVAIEMVALDDLVFNQKLPPPNFVKIDVEGAELDVLQGMERILRTYHPPLLFEIDDEFQDEFERKAKACTSYLEHRGYEITRLEDAYPTLNWHVGHFLAIPNLSELEC